MAVLDILSERIAMPVPVLAAVGMMVVLILALVLNATQRRSASLNGLRCSQCSKFLVPLKYSVVTMETGCCPHCGYRVLHESTAGGSQV